MVGMIYRNSIGRSNFIWTTSGSSGASSAPVDTHLFAQRDSITRGPAVYEITTIWTAVSGHRYFLCVFICWRFYSACAHACNLVCLDRSFHTPAILARFALSANLQRMYIYMYCSLVYFNQTTVD